jgi:hypothetical protein
LDYLRAALAYYARFGIQFRALLTDNGPAYGSIQTTLREWAYARTYQCGTATPEAALLRIESQDRRSEQVVSGCFFIGELFFIQVGRGCLRRIARCGSPTRSPSRSPLPGHRGYSCGGSTGLACCVRPPGPRHRCPASPRVAQGRRESGPPCGEVGAPVPFAHLSPLSISIYR